MANINTDPVNVWDDARHHRAFVHGIHFCPGASIVRLEGHPVDTPRARLENPSGRGGAMELLECHDRALGATRALVADVRDDQWRASTPCDGWDVHGLVNHVVAGNYWAGELAVGRTIGEVGDRLDGDMLGEDPIAAYDASAKASSDAFHAAGALERPCAVSYGPVPGSVYLGHRFLDVFVHGWDLAVATGQPSDLDESLAQACLDVIEPQAEELAASGMFGEPFDVTADANAGTRLLALLGRST